jgi:hypothetical protein
VTREQFIVHWQVMEAYKNGASVQVLDRDTWKNVEFPDFVAERSYRVKPVVPYTLHTFPLKYVGKLCKNGNCSKEIMGVTKDGVIFHDFSRTNWVHLCNFAVDDVALHQ